MGHREELLQAARRLLEEKGYARTTARDLVAESGTNLASIGYHFGSKEELLNTAIGAVLGEWTEQLAAIAMARPVDQPVDRARIAWLEMLDSLPGKRMLLLSFVEALGQAERAPALRAQFAEQYQQCRRRVAGLAATEYGVPEDDPRCQALASFVIAVCDGLAVQWLFDPEHTPTSAELEAALGMVWAAAYRSPT